MRYELTDHEWTAIRPMLPNKPRGVPRVNDRRVLCVQAHHGAICRFAMAHAPPATIASSGGEKPEYGTISWTRLPPLMMRLSK